MGKINNGQFKIGHKPIPGAFSIGSKHTEESKKKMSLSHKKNPSKYWLGKKHSNETIKKLRESHLGHKPPKTAFKKGDNNGKKHPQWKGGKNRCVVCNKKLSNYISKKCLPCFWKENIGENNPRYIKDRTKLQKSEKKYKNVQYIYWAKSIKKRDNWKCKLLSAECNGQLEAHHIFNWIDYPELRYILTNGIALCAFHHPRGREKEKRMIPIFQELLSVSKEQI